VEKIKLTTVFEKELAERFNTNILASCFPKKYLIEKIFVLTVKLTKLWEFIKNFPSRFFKIYKKNYLYNNQDISIK
jgi:hypothetical protein